MDDGEPSAGQREDTRRSTAGRARGIARAASMGDARILHLGNAVQALASRALFLPGESNDVVDPDGDVDALTRLCAEKRGGRKDHQGRKEGTNGGWPDAVHWAASGSTWMCRTLTRRTYADAEASGAMSVKCARSL